MATRNNHTYSHHDASARNVHQRQTVLTARVSDPTLANGDGTFTVPVDEVRELSGTNDVVGVNITGIYKASVDSVDDGDVTVLIQEPSGAGTYGATADGELTGETLTVQVSG